MSERVILLHGIWMRAFVLAAFARGLRRAGFAVDTFDYPGVLRGVAHAVPMLRARMRAARADRVHLVGHSLGGLVAVEAVRGATDLPPGRVVCLGSPLNGSRAARSLGRIPGGTLLTGGSHRLLCDGVAAWTGERAVGVVAGRVPYGAGSLIAALPSPHDGTVAVSETMLPGIAGHCIVSATHTGLLFSEDAIRQALQFLAHGRFDGDRANPG